MRPPASPVGSVSSDTHSMNPRNGASSSIRPGSEEGIGGRHGFPGMLAGADVYNEWIEILLTSMLDDAGLRLAVEQAMTRPKTVSLLPASPTAITSARRHGTSSRSVIKAWLVSRSGNSPSATPAWGVVRHQSDRRGLPASRRAAAFHRLVIVGGARGKLMVAAQEGTALPLGWALDKRGNPTTDPKAGLEGSMLAAGRHILPTGSRGRAWKFLKLRCKNRAKSPPKS